MGGEKKSKEKEEKGGEGRRGERGRKGRGFESTEFDSRVPAGLGVPGDAAILSVSAGHVGALTLLLFCAISAFLHVSAPF